MRPLVLSIGSTDPWNAAGLGLDIGALAACGARAVTVVAGVTAQDRAGVLAASPIAPDLIAAQFASLARAEISAIRIGALLDPRSVEAVARFLGDRARAGAVVPVVYDPVLGPSGSGAFADDATVDAIVRDLLCRVDLVTPNLAESGRLAGTSAPTNPGAMARIGATLRASGAAAALVKGGHLAGEATDVLVTARGERRFVGPRLAGTLRGTGCLLADSIAASLARGRTLEEAIEAGRAFVRDRFSNATEIAGMRVAY